MLAFALFAQISLVRQNHFHKHSFHELRLLNWVTASNFGQKIAPRCHQLCKIDLFRP